jgi:hypothetical protein
VAIADRTASTLYVLDPDGHRVGLSVFDFGAEASASARPGPSSCSMVAVEGRA